jgi:hypothetical protein
MPCGLYKFGLSSSFNVRSHRLYHFNLEASSDLLWVCVESDDFGAWWGWERVRVTGNAGRQPTCMAGASAITFRQPNRDVEFRLAATLKPT